MGSLMTEGQAPLLTTMQYNKYVRSLVKLLIGEKTLNEWIRKGENRFWKIIYFLLKIEFLNGAVKQSIKLYYYHEIQ